MELTNNNSYKNRLFLLLFFIFSSSVFLQSQTINLISFNNTTTYTTGSSVSVIMNPTGVFLSTNQFVLELSAEGGSWVTPTVLSTLDEFYTPVVNGILPATLASGSYKLRVRATQPAVIVETGSFNVIANSALPTFPNFKSNITNGTSSFNCIKDCSSANNIFGQLQAASNATTNLIGAQRICTICNFDLLSSTYFARLINVQNSTVQNLTISADGTFDMPNGLEIGAYAVEIESKSSTGISSISSNIFIFQGSGTGFGNASGETVCVGSSVDFGIDLSPISGIGRNYLGSKYCISFGDGTEKWLTHAQLLANPAISHVFDAASCGSGAGSQAGLSEVKFSLYNKGVYSSLDGNYCTMYLLNGSGVKKFVNVSKAPVADFSVLEKQCLSIDIVAVNKTAAGSYGTDVCLSKPDCYWWYKKPSSTTFKLVDDVSWVNELGDLKIPNSAITEPGCWEIKLETQNPIGCNTVTEKVRSIQIEATPIPAFTMSPVSPICANSSIKFTNTTNVIGFTCQDPTYSWVITPAGAPATVAGIQYINGTSETTVDPEVRFTQPGIYWVSLSVTNSCGIVSSTPVTIQINGDPSVSANSDEMTECAANTGNSATPADYTLDLATAAIRPIYSLVPYAPASYEWTIGGAGVTAADYSYTGGTSQTSPYPKIKFTAFKTYTLKVKVNGNCTVNNEKTVTYTLNEIPAITNPNTDFSQVICSGTFTAPLALTSSMSGTTFNWSIASSTIGTNPLSPSSGSGTTIPAIAFENISTTNGTVKFTIIPQNNGCSGGSKELVVTVYPKLSVHTFVPISLCNNTPFTAEPFISDVPVATFAWTNDNTAIGLAASGTGNLPTFTPANGGTAPIVANVTVTPKDSICSGESFTFEIYVNPTPTVADVANMVKCNGEQSEAISFTGTVPGTVYKWTNDNSSIGIPVSGDGNISPRALINNTTTVQVATITVTPTFTYMGTMCSGTPKTFTITVNPTANVVQPANQNICNGGSTSNITFATPNTGGTTTYTWTNSVSSIGLAASGSGDIPAFAVINTGNSPKIATITVTPTFTNAGISCTGAAKTFTITANPIPSIQSLSNKEFCDGVTTNAIVFDIPVAATICTWTNSNPAIGLAATGTGNIPAFVAINSTANPITATIEVTPTAYGCTGVMHSFTITINPTIKTVLSSPAQTICSGESTTAVTLSSASAAVTYNWEVLPSPGVVVSVTSGSTNTIPAQTLVNTTASPVNVVFEATAILTDGTGCVGPKSIHTITVNPKATIGTINSTICSGGTFSVAPDSGGGNIIPTGTTYTWGAPTINSPGAITGGTGQSTPQTTIGEALTNTTAAIATATYSVIPTSGACVGAPFDVVVTVNPTPTVNSVSNRVYCAGETSSQIDFVGDVAGSVFDWTCDNTSIGILSAETDKISVFTTTNNTTSPIVATITVTPKANGCVGIAKQFTITVNPRPVITTSLGGIVLCNNTPSVSIPLVGDVSGTTFDWTNDATDIGLAATGTGNIPGFTAVNHGLLPLIATITVTPKANGCEGTPKSFTITVNPTPTVNAITSQELCSEFQTTSIDFTGNIGTTTYNWVNSNSAIGLAAGGFGNIPAFTAINGGSTVLTATVTVTPTVNDCSGSSVTFNIVVNPSPAFTTQPASNSICKDGSLPALSVAFKNGTGTASYQWFSNTADNTATGTAIPSATSDTYTPPSTLLEQITIIAR